MSRAAMPLLHYLTKANPEVDSSWSLTDRKSANPSKSRSKAATHDKRFLEDILEWEGIGLEKDLEPLFGDILSFPVNNMPTFEDALQHPRHLNEIHDESSFEALLIRWNYAIVSAALSIAQHHEEFPRSLYARDHVGEISMAKGGQAWIPEKNRRTQRQDKTIFPDWAGIILEDDENAKLGQSHQDNARHYLNVLPGDTKLSTKFRSEWGKRDQRFEASIIQVFTYCRRANVRYGYIVTQEELVVIRLFWGNKGEPNSFNATSDKRLYLEYKSIPWVNSGDDKLTINLTLWCLHMLAARKKSIGGRNDLQSEYQPSDSSSGGNISEQDNSMEARSGDSTPSNTIYHSFKRPLSEDVGAQNAPIKRAKRSRK
ncbi:hypothetical protein MMC18_009184 [Xylographa bjoerkii]|nr:hypothetical protein [Xylographa bjoerkii]